MSELLVKLGKESFAKHEFAESKFSGDADANALINDLQNHPHAFVLGCLMDRQIPAEKAWAIPYRVKQLLETFAPDELKRRSFNEWHALFKQHTLHRYTEKMARVFYLGVQDISEKYGGDASRIWSGKPSSNDVVLRFRQFHGVGQKISTMAANILVRHFRVPLADHAQIDISVDVHIKRVMQRAGLVPPGAKCAQIIKTARALHPDFPGIFDYACWKIGKHHCKPENPDCTNCPARTECKYHREHANR